MRIKGIFEAKSGGFGFVRTESGDIYIPEALKKGAMNGQEVEAEITEKGYSGQNDRGRIVKVLSPYPEIVGSVYKGKNAVFVVPDNSAYDDIFIPKGRAGGAEDGDKVVAFERILSGDTVIGSHEDLNDEGQTVTEILAQLGDESLTNQRVSALLRQMTVHKEVVKGKSLFSLA